MNVFLLAGQSNMQGFGHIEGYPKLSDERIFNFATGMRMLAQEPLHHWEEHAMPEGIGLGLAMPFAIEVLRQMPEQKIGFIPAARGGSRLEEWMPGNANFERAIQLCERAAGNDPEIRFAGLLWHQGEADSAAVETAATYGERLIEVFQGFRSRLGDSKLPIVAGELGRFLALNAHYFASETVVAQTRRVIDSLERAAFATSEGLVCDGSHTHFETVSIRQFGIRYADAFLRIVRPVL